MFTGLIEETGTVKNAESAGEGIVLEINARRVLEGTREGDSISVDGVCLTVTGRARDSFTVFASRVSLSLSTLGKVRAGDRVNLERALSVNSRLGGHFVQGHVDGTGKITSISRDGSGVSFRVEVPAEILKYIVPRGSVAVDGISLTAVDVTPRSFDLYLIPETVSATALAFKKTGDMVNVEVDILGKYVEKILSRQGDQVDKEKDGVLLNKLRDEGYI